MTTSRASQPLARRETSGAAERTEAPSPTRAAAEVPGIRRALVVCDQWLGSNGYAGMKALRRTGVAVTVVPEMEFVPVKWRRLSMRLLGRLLRARAVGEFNDELMRQARRVAPDLLLVFKGTFVRGDTLRRLRAMGIRSYCFYPDVSFRAHGPWIPDALPEYDWVFTTKTFGLRDLEAQLGVRRASLLSHAFDPDLHRPLPLDEDDLARYGCDVSFIGTWSPKKARMLAALAARRPALRLRIWGEQWDRAGSRSRLDDAIVGHELVGEAYVRAIRASRINLGLLSERRVGASDGDQITSRTFHIPASGGFLLHERTSELLERFREDEHVACFDGVEEMLTKIDAWLAAPAERAAVAARARELVAMRDGWDARIAVILEHHRRLTAA